MLDVVMHLFNPSAQETDGSEFKASLVYKASSKKARSTQKPCLKKTKHYFINRTLYSIGV